jgi:hypothetical protein
MHCWPASTNCQHELHLTVRSGSIACSPGGRALALCSARCALAATRGGPGESGCLDRWTADRLRSLYGDALARVRHRRRLGRHGCAI